MGGLLARPRWSMAWSADEFSSSSTFNAFESKMLASLVDTILPDTGEGLGGLSLGIDLFLQRLFDRCYPEENRQLIKSSLTYLDERAHLDFQASFIACHSDQREQLFLDLNQSESSTDTDFFKLMKTETIRGFCTSRKVMTKYYNYRIAPGFYDGCVDVDA